MKKRYTIILSVLSLTLLAASIAWFFIPAQNPPVTAGHAHQHADPTYVCPMHPQIVRNKPGTCPICGMDLVKKEPETIEPIETAEEHARKHADPTYVCPMHPQIVKNKQGTCPICGMDLVKKEPETIEPIETAEEHARKHADPTYVCPMHPQIVKNKQGTCPICGMDLVKKEPETIEPKETAFEHALKHADPTYVCPMHPQIVRNKPGTCPICGMDLVKKAAKNNNNTRSKKDALPSIKVKANTAQNMGIRTLSIEQNKLSRTIHTIGFVNYNEDTLYHIHARSNGWLEKTHIKTEGDVVKKGSTLADFYSPEIVAAAKDLLIAKRSGKLLAQSGAASLVEAAKQKLRLLEVPESVIKRIQNTGKSQNTIPILAPQKGVVINMGVRDGMYVTPKLQMYSIADLSSVWVQVDVFGHHFDWVKVGNKAEMSVEGLAGEVWTGKVDYIYPELNPLNRTLKVRLKFNTPQQKLKPNMFANVTLFSAPKKVLSVPNEAVIYYENSPRIIKVVGKDRYQPIEVKLGMRSEGQIEILDGLKENDKVVVSGQFMLDSESNLQASFRRLAE